MRGPQTVLRISISCAKRCRDSESTTVGLITFTAASTAALRFAEEDLPHTSVTDPTEQLEAAELRGVLGAEGSRVHVGPWSLVLAVGRSVERGSGLIRRIVRMSAWIR